MKIEGYEVKEIAPGVTEYVLKDSPHTTFVKEQPWIHIHYQTGDEESDKTGVSRVELCCHGCNSALWVTLDWPLEKDAAKPVLDQFSGRHAGCWKGRDSPASPLEEMIYKALRAKGEHPMQSLCPPARDHMHAIDMRGKLGDQDK